MKEFRIFYIVLTLITFAMCFVYQSRLMPLILTVLLICPVISLILVLISFFSIKARLEPGEIIAEKGEDFVVSLKLSNSFVFPVSPIRIIGDFQSLHEGEQTYSEKTLMTDVAPLGITCVNLPFRLPFRGEYTVRVREYSVYDLLKIFRLRRKLNMSSRIIVLPREKIPVGQGQGSETESESPASIVAANRSNVFNSLREYRQGDSIRNIHWKLTAKQDELIVKQMEKSVNNSAVIFSDFSADLGNVFFTRRIIDAVLETALGISKKVLLDGNGVINCWQGESGAEKYEATEFSHYSYLHATFTMLPQEPSEKPLGELITVFSSELGEQHSVYLIAPLIKKELLDALEQSGLSTRDDVTLVTFSAVTPVSEIDDYIKTRTKIKLVELSDESPYMDICVN